MGSSTENLRSSREVRVSRLAPRLGLHGFHRFCNSNLLCFHIVFDRQLCQAVPTSEPGARESYHQWPVFRLDPCKGDSRCPIHAVAITDPTLITLDWKSMASTYPNPLPPPTLPQHHPLCKQTPLFPPVSVHGDCADHESVRELECAICFTQFWSRDSAMYAVQSLRQDKRNRRNGLIEITLIEI